MKNRKCVDHFIWSKRTYENTKKLTIIKQSYVFLLILVVVLAFVPTAVHGLEQSCPDCEKEPEKVRAKEMSQDEIPITVWTDKSMYKHGEKIMVEGKVANIASGFPVTITVVNPFNNIVAIDQVNVANDGSYNITYQTDNNSWRYDGIYTIKVQYGHSESDKTTIELIDRNEKGVRPEIQMSDPFINSNNEWEFQVTGSGFIDNFSIKVEIDWGEMLEINTDTPQGIERFIDRHRFLESNFQSDSNGDFEIRVTSPRFLEDGYVRVLAKDNLNEIEKIFFAEFERLPKNVVTFEVNNTNLNNYILDIHGNVQNPYVLVNQHKIVSADIRDGEILFSTSNRVNPDGTFRLIEDFSLPEGNYDLVIRTHGIFRSTIISIQNSQLESKPTQSESEFFANGRMTQNGIEWCEENYQLYNLMGAEFFEHHQHSIESRICGNLYDDPLWTYDNSDRYEKLIERSKYYTSLEIEDSKKEAETGIIDTKPVNEPDPELKSIETQKRIEHELPIAPFVDPTKDPQYYIDRYNTESKYKQWFNENYPKYDSIEQAVGLEITRKIPEWVQNTALWYGQGQISENEFLNAIEYLIKEGIIKRIE